MSVQKNARSFLLYTIYPKLIFQIKVYAIDIKT